MAQPLSPPRASCCLYVIAILLIGQAIALGAEQFSVTALVLIGVAIVLVGASVWGWKIDCPVRVERGLMLVAVIGGLIRLPIDALFHHGAVSQGLEGPFIGLGVFAGAAAAGVLLGSERAVVLGGFVMLLTAHLAMALIALGTRLPHIDVYLIQYQGCRALTHGFNPYAMTFQNIYATPENIYPPGLVVGGRVQCGYFYPPVSLLLDLPGYLLGEVRYAHIASMIACALMIGYLMPGQRASRSALGAAALLLLSPRIFFQLRMAWIEPLVLLPLCAAVFFAVRRCMWAAAVAVGVFAVSKQYALLTIPAVWLLMERPARRSAVAQFALIAAGSACAVTLPFVLWGPSAFFHSMTALFVGIMRSDSISFFQPLSKVLGLRPSLAFGATAALLAGVLSVWRAPRTPEGFAASIALILLCLFALSPQAFGNYYFLTVGALCLAIAAQGEGVTSACADSPPSSAGHINR